MNNKKKVIRFARDIRRHFRKVDLPLSVKLAKDIMKNDGINICDIFRAHGFTVDHFFDDQDFWPDDIFVVRKNGDWCGRFTRSGFAIIFD